MQDIEPGGVLPATHLAPRPGSRVFRTSRSVRLGDADRSGRLRLDALARHLQDVAIDDYADSGIDQDRVVWVVRRSAVRVPRWPCYQERLTYATFCTGMGAQWAERRTSVTGDAGGQIEAAVLWVATDPGSGRPAPPPPRFAELWGVTGDTRRLSARLLQPPPPVDGGRPWAVRATDLDVVGHANNAMQLAAVEDELAQRLPGRIPVTAVCEYRTPIDADDRVSVVSQVGGATLRAWLVSPRGLHAAATVETEAPR
jgi:acyl-ACP thioesterase